MNSKHEVDHIDYHKDGSIRAKGKMRNGILVGYWEWFRKDGTKLRSGHFENGVQSGEWITYDQKGKVYKVTQMKARDEKRKSDKTNRSGTARKK